MAKLLVAALLGAFILSSVANAADVSSAPTKKIKTENKIESIRIVPKQDRNIASEDDGFIPVLTPKPKAKAQEKRKPATAKDSKCAGSKCSKNKSSKNAKKA